MKINVAVNTDGVNKAVQLTMTADDAQSSYCAVMDAPSAKKLAEVLVKIAAEASSVIISPGFDSTGIKGV